MRELKLDRETDQIFNAEADATIREINANVFPQMLASNKIIESTNSKKIEELQINKIRSLLPKLNRN